jgi:hypothetical protein
MRAKSAGPILILILTVLMILPNTFFPRVQGVNQNGQTFWSPYGPRETTLIFNFYSDFVAMFNAFKAGSIDITDWPAFRADLSCNTNPSCFQNNPDFFVTNPTSELGLFDLEINYHNSFLGVKQLTGRIVSPPGIIGTPTTAAGCSTGFSSLIVNLVNQEENNAPVKDSLNTVTIKGPQTFTVSDSGGSNPTGTYNFPCSRSQLLAGTYTISTSVYNGTATLSLGSGQIITITLGVNYNSPSTQKLTPSGIELRRALAHLLDKPNFVQFDSSLQGRDACDDVFASPAQGLGFGSCRASADGLAPLPQSVLDEDLAEHPWAASMGIIHGVSAYNLASDLIGGGQLWWNKLGGGVGANAGYEGVADLRAACDHLVKAGFTITPSNATCTDIANASLGTVAPSSYPHLNNNGQHASFFIRNSPPRKHFGYVVLDSLNFLFGTPNTQFGPPNDNATVFNECAITIPFDFCSQFAIPFGDGLSPDTWNMYTGGYFLPDTPDQFYTFMHSQFASNICGGVVVNFPSNFNFHCDPAFDTQAAAGEFAPTLGQSISFFNSTAVLGHRTVMDVPIFTRLFQNAALNGWNFQDTATPTKSSLVVGNHVGFAAGHPGAFWSMLNMRQKPGSQTVCTSPGVPVGCTNNSNYLPGGGNPNLIRRSESQDTDLLSPFQATTVWDFDVIGEVFDTLLQVNPDTSSAGGTSQQIDWMTTSHTSLFNQAEQSCLPGGGCATGTTTQIWRLRKDLFFHDGQPVTADDVVYTILAYRDVPSAIFQPDVASVSSARALDTKTVEVKLQHQSPFFELGIGSVPIIPKHLWAPICGPIVNGSIPTGPKSKCADPLFDPMASSILIGSGPFVCNNITTGAVGGSCSQNADGSTGGQSVTLGGKIVLKAYNAYMRCCPGLQNSSLHKFSWADRNNDGIVNILDIADVAFSFGKPDPYWNTGQNPLAPNVGTDPAVVDIGEIATVAFYFSHGLFNNNQGLTSSTITGLDPCIDPFFQASPPC